MSKYQQRTIINNPEKMVPDYIVQQFFMKIKNADLDGIREFALNYKNKYNLIDKSIRGSSSDSYKNPFHVVLELDDKIASNNDKLRMMQYLDMMGAPIDLPDVNNIWPIHLAASIQSNKIIDFLLKKNVSLTRKDTSNNTPLHYAVIGREIDCPKKIAIGSLTPSLKIDNMALNQTLEKTNTSLIKLLNHDTNISEMLIHMINTIMKIPQMYDGDPYSEELSANVINIFTDISLDPKYPSQPENIDRLTLQQTKLEELINQTYSTINENLLHNLTMPIDIKPNLGGWGPELPLRQPTPTEKILADQESIINSEINDKYQFSLDKIKSVSEINTMLYDEIPMIISDAIFRYQDKLIFCTDCPTINYGEEVGLTKMLYLLSLNYYLSNYPSFFADKIMNTFIIMQNSTHDEISDNVDNDKTWGRGFSSNRAGNLFGSTLHNIINDSVLDTTRSNLDQAISEVLLVPHYGDRYNDCIRDTLSSLVFSTSNLNNDLVINVIDAPFNTINDLLNTNTIGNIAISYTINIPSTVDPNDKFINQLWDLVERIAPRSIDPRFDIFFTDYYNSNYGMGLPAGNFLIPFTMLPHDPNIIPVAYINDRYNRMTYYELFRIFQLIDKYLTTGDFRPYEYPRIFGTVINNWDSYVDSIGINIVGTRPIIELYPEYIFLYKILVKRVRILIKNAISDCLHSVFLDVRNDTSLTYNQVTMFNQLFKPLDDYYALNMLLPVTNFVKPNMLVWDNNNSLVKWFTGFVQSGQFPFSFINVVANLLISRTGSSSHSAYQLRSLITSDVPLNINIIRDILSINNMEFRTEIRKYFNKPDTDLSIIKIYNTILKNINVDNNVVNNNALYLNSLRAGTITDLFFLTEMYGYHFFTSIQELTSIHNELIITYNIISDSVNFINKEYYYYVPQIFLPALVKRIIQCIQLLSTLKNKITAFDTSYGDFYIYLDINIETNKNIINLGTEFNTYLIKQIALIQKKLDLFIEYHNNIISFLNLSNARRLIYSDRSIANKVFDMNLILMKALPRASASTGTTTLTLNNYVSEIINQYITTKIHYYDDSNMSDMSDTRDSSHHTLLTNILNTSPRLDINSTYRNIILYHRNGDQISNSPNIGQNYQLNIDSTNIHNVPNAISGNWLNNTDPTNIRFSNAFIGYNKNQYSYNWLNGMPPSIRYLVDSHLKIIKYQIIKNIIQKVVTNYHQANQDIELASVYKDLATIGTADVYELDPAKTYIVLGKIADSLINKFLEYVIKQSIASWIYSLVSKDQRYKPIINRMNNMINIIIQKDYLKMSLNEININTINKLIGADANIDHGLPQIETSVQNIPFVTPNIEATTTVTTQFINYLYSIDYYSDTNTALNKKKCYQVNPSIVEKLITPDTINSQNSDGLTPLHLAAQNNNLKIIKLLIEHKAVINLKNIHGQTVNDINMISAEIHFGYSAGSTVYESISNFVIPFNDLLLSRLKDDKYNNNIIKNITYAIPIQLIMYNHLFHINLENYRIGFTFELKKDIIELINKYFDQKNTIYPIDLFEINNASQIEAISIATNPESSLTKRINKNNQYEIEKLEKEIELLDIQINGLKRERGQLHDAIEIQIIDKSNEIIVEKRTEKAAKLLSLSIKTPPRALVRQMIQVTPLMHIYNSMVNRIKNMNRSLSLLDFYNESFKNIGNSKDLYLAIWKNYFDKKLNESPSMIFSLMFSIINKILVQIKLYGTNNTIKSDLKTINSFFQIVHNYIEQQETYPSNYNQYDNPILTEELDQISYLINLILTQPIQNIITTQIYQGLQQLDVTGIITNDPNVVLNEINQVKSNGQTLNSYLTDILPKLAIKIFTNIYSSGSDIDRKNINSSDIFMPLIKIIQANTLIRITDESVLIQNFKNYLIPFMVNTYQNFIHHLRLAIFGFKKYLLNTFQFVDNLII